MPIFHIKIFLASGKSFSEYRDVPNIDLDTYYLEMHKKAVDVYGMGLADFDVTQVSIYSRVADAMRVKGTQRLVQRKR